MDFLKISNRIIDWTIKNVSPWHLLWISATASVIFTLIIETLLTLILWGHFPIREEIILGICLGFIVDILVVIFVIFFFVRLKESEDLFETLSDNMPVGLDMHRERFIYTNPALQNMLGYTWDELKDMYFWDMLAEEHKEEAKRAIKEGLSDIFYKHYVTFKLIKKSGEELWAYIYAGSVKYKGEIVRIASFIDVTEHKKLEEELSFQALYDVLTGLPNRRSLMNEMKRAASRVTRRKTFLAVAILDLDDFKPVNDTHGHEAGDKVLKIIAGRLKNNLRKSDFVARLGGDEFVLIVEDFKDKSELENVFEKIEKAVMEDIILGPGIKVSVGLSMGVGICAASSGSKEADNPGILLRYADNALYESKRNKQKRLHYYFFYGETPL